MKTIFKYLLKVAKRLVGIILLIALSFVMFIPMVLMMVFIGCEKMNDTMDRIMIYPVLLIMCD